MWLKVVVVGLKAAAAKPKTAEVFCSFSTSSEVPAIQDAALAQFCWPLGPENQTPKEFMAPEVSELHGGCHLASHSWPPRGPGHSKSSSWVWRKRYHPSRSMTKHAPHTIRPPCPACRSSPSPSPRATAAGCRASAAASCRQHPGWAAGCATRRCFAWSARPHGLPSSSR